MRCGRTGRDSSGDKEHREAGTDRLGQAKTCAAGQEWKGWAGSRQEANAVVR